MFKEFEGVCKEVIKILYQGIQAVEKMKWRCGMGYWKMVEKAVLYKVSVHKGKNFKRVNYFK